MASLLLASGEVRSGSCAWKSVWYRSRGTSDHSSRYCGRSRLDVYYELCTGRCLPVKAGAREIRDPARSEPANLRENPQRKRTPDPMTTRSDNVTPM